MIFQSELTNIDSELINLEMMLKAKHQQREFFQQLQTQADECLKGLSRVVNHAKESGSAIASLKSAVLTLFDSGDNGNDGGNQPTAPTPQPDDDEPELLCLNGETGDCLTTADIDEEEIPADNPVGDQWILSSSAPLNGKTCAIDPDFYWESTPPDGSEWELASPIACLLWEDAQRLGQHCKLTSHWDHDWELEPLDGQAWEIATPLCCLLSDVPTQKPYIELVSHPENKALAYQRRHDGEIICTYIGFRTKAIAQSWMHYVEAVTCGVELRSSKRMQGFKWEMKVKGLSVRQIERLAKEDLTKTYRPEIGSTKPPTYKPQPIPQPVNPDEVGEGDIVTQLLTPSASYKVIQVMPNGILDCENTTTGQRLGLRPAAVSLVQKVNTKVPIAECSIVDAPLEQPEPTELTITSAQWEELKKLATDGGLSQEQLGDIALAPYDYQRGSQIKTSQFAEVKRKLERAIANIRIAKENQQMLDGIAATVFDQKFQQQNTRLSMGATHGR
jgi:hypothetical protein